MRAWRFLMIQQQYQLQSQQMFQKNSPFDIFSSCYSGHAKENEYVPAVVKMKAHSFRKEPKISLKRTGQQSARSSANSTPTKELKPQQPPQTVTPLKTPKKQCLSDLTQLLNQPSLQKICDSSKKGRTIAQISPELPETKKFVHFKYINQNESRNCSDLQKTTKGCYLDKQDNYNCGQSINSELRKTRTLNKDNFIKSLSDYKDSLVSLHIQTEPMHLQMQESSILIDYFNPSQSRAMELKDMVEKKE